MKRSLVACHVETTGINTYSKADVGQVITDGYNIVSAGFIICDEDYNVKKSELFYNSDVVVGDDYQYHGINQEFLDEYGFPEKEMSRGIAEFIRSEYSREPITLIGFNTATFVLPFLKDVLYRHENPIDFTLNMVDVYSMMFGFIGDYTLNDVVEVFSKDEWEENKVKEMAVLKKVKAFLEACKYIRKVAEQ